MMRMVCFMRAKVQLYVETTKDFFWFLAILHWFSQGNTWFFEGGGLEGAVSYRPEAMFSRHSLWWNPEVATAWGGDEQGLASAMDDAMTDAEESECLVERCYHSGFWVVPEEGIQNLYPERAGECIDVSDSLFPDSWWYWYLGGRGRQTSHLLCPLYLATWKGVLSPHRVPIV